MARIRGIIDDIAGTVRVRAALSVREPVAAVWVTPAGSLGSAVETTTPTFVVEATPAGVTYNLASGVLPPGLSLDSISGTITGTVEDIASTTDYTFTVRGTYRGSEIEREFAITVLANAVPVWVTPAGSLGQIKEFDAVAIQLVATDPGDTLTYALTDESAPLPAGLALNPDGSITGTVSGIDTDSLVPFTVRVTDSTGNFADRSFVLTVREVQLRVYSAAGPTEMLNDAGEFVRRIGGPSDGSRGIASDQYGNYYVGNTNVNPVFGYGVTKYSPRGQLLWVDSSHASAVYRVVVDSTGRVFSTNNSGQIRMTNPDGSSGWGVPHHNRPVTALVVTDHGLYSSSQDSFLRRIDKTTGVEVWGFQGPQFPQHQPSAAASPDGETIYTVHYNNVRAVSAAGNVLWTTAPSTAAVDDIAVLWNGDLIISGRDRRLRRLSPTGQVIWASDQFAAGAVEHVAVDPFGNIFCAAYEAGQFTHSISKHSSADGSLLWTRPQPGRVYDLTTHVLGSVIAAGLEDVRAYGANGDLAWVHDSTRTSRDVAVDAGDRVYTAESGSLYSYDAEGYLLWVNVDAKGESGGLNAIAVDQNNNVFSGGGGLKVRKYDSSGASITTLLGLPGTIYDIAVDDDGNAYIGSGGGSITKMSATTNQQVWRYTAAGVSDIRSVTLDQHGNVYGCGTDGAVVKLDAAGALIWQITHAGGTPKMGIAVDPEGNVYVGSASTAPFLAKLDSDGNQTARLDLDVGFRVTDLKIDAGMLFLSTTDHKIRCISTELAILWTYDGTPSKANPVGLYLVSSLPDRPLWTTGAGQIADVEEYSELDLTVASTSPLVEPITYTVGLGALPGGVTLDPDTGNLAGIVGGSEQGEYSVFYFEIVATNSAGSSKQLFWIRVRNNQPPVWDTAAGDLFEILENTAMPSDSAVMAVDPDGQDVVYVVVDGTLPPGITMGDDGVFAGTPDPVAADLLTAFTVRASDPFDEYSDRQFSITVLKNQPPIWLTPVGLVRVVVEQVPDTFTFEAKDPETGVANTDVVFAVAAGALPAGLTLAGTGVVSGTPDEVVADTEATFIVSATDNVGNVAVRQFSIRVLANEPPVWQTPSGLIGTAVENDTVTIQPLAIDAILAATAGAVGGPITFTVVAGAVPVGLTMNPATATMTGTLATAETATFTLRATDQQGRYAEREFTYVVLDNQPPAWETPAMLGESVENLPFSVTLEAIDFEGLAVTYSVAPGSTPPGTLAVTGNVLSGTLPTVSADSTPTFVLRASDPAGNFVDGTFSVTILDNLPIVWISTGSLGEVKEFDPGNFIVEAEHPYGLAITYAVQAGALPPGLTLAANGTISGLVGSVEADTVFTFTVRATDTAGGTSDRVLSIKILDVPLYVHVLASDEVQRFTTSGTERTSLTPVVPVANLGSGNPMASLLAATNTHIYAAAGTKLRAYTAAKATAWTYYGSGVIRCMAAYGGSLFVGTQASIVQLDALTGAVQMIIPGVPDMTDIAANAAGTAIVTGSVVRKYNTAGVQVFTQNVSGFSAVEMDAAGNVYIGSGTTTGAAISRRHPTTGVQSAVTTASVTRMAMGGDGNLYGMIGGTLHRFAPALGASNGSVLVGSGTVTATAGGAAHHYIVQNNVLYKIAYATLTQTYSRQLPTVGITTYTVAEGATGEVYVSGAENFLGYVTLFNTNTDAMIWSMAMGILGINSGHVFRDGSFILAGTRYILRYNADITLAWRYDSGATGGSITERIVIDSTGAVYFLKNLTLGKLSPDGTVIFQTTATTAAGVSTMAIGPGDELYLGTSTGILQRNSTVDGSVMWSRTLPAAALNGLAVDAEAVYAGTGVISGTPMHKYTHAGILVWQVGWAVGSTTPRAMSVYDRGDSLYVTFANRTVAKYRTSDGGLEWNVAVSNTSGAGSFDNISASAAGTFLAFDDPSDSVVKRYSSAGDALETFDAQARVNQVDVRDY